MPSDSEITKNQETEGDAKPNLDTTDSSQDSVAAKSEVEDEKDKSTEEVKEENNKKENDTKKSEEKENNGDIEENDTDKKDEVDGKDVKNNKDEKKEEVKSEEDTEEGDQSGDEEDDDEETNDKKDVPLLDQPLEKSGKRERKNVQRFNEDFPTESKEPTKTEIPEGEGTQLGEIPRIDASIARFKTDDLKLLHKILFKTPGKNTIIKKNIRKFNGFDFKKDSEGYTKKVQQVGKMELKQLKSICEMLDLEKNGKKEEITDRICEFLLEPKDSGKPVGGGRPKRTAAVRANNRGYSSHDDNSDSDAGSRRISRRGKGKRVNLKDESSSESDAEFNPSEESGEEEKTPRVTAKKRPGRSVKKPQESEDEASEVEETPTSDEESDEPKSKRKKAPVAKTPNNKSKRTAGKRGAAKKSPGKKKGAKAAKKRSKNESESEDEDDKDNSENNEESSSGDDEPLVKKSKTPQPPTDDEIKTFVKEILEGANLEEITMKTVCKQVYAHYPDFDLAHKKDFIKSTVKSLIST